MHRSVSITNDARKKPDVIVFYDHTKGGVDAMDQMAGCFTTRFKSNRWTMNALSYVLDTVRTNMNTPWNEIIKLHIEYRYQKRNGIQTDIVNAMKNFLGIKDNQVPEIRTHDRKRCYFCIAAIQGEGSKGRKNKLAKVRWQCQADDCGKTVCQQHFILYCHPCNDKMKNNE